MSSFPQKVKALSCPHFSVSDVNMTYIITSSALSHCSMSRPNFPQKEIAAIASSCPCRSRSTPLLRRKIALLSSFIPQINRRRAASKVSLPFSAPDSRSNPSARKARSRIQSVEVELEDACSDQLMATAHAHDQARYRGTACEPFDGTGTRAAHSWKATVAS